LEQEEEMLDAVAKYFMFSTLFSTTPRKEMIGMISLHFEKLSMYARHAEPCSAAIPFPQGELTDSLGISIYDEDRVLPSQTHITSVWPDGSIKWLMVHFLADLPANQAKTLQCRMEPKKGKLEQSVRVEGYGNQLFVDTGVVRIECAGPGDNGILRSIRRQDGEFDLQSILGPSYRNEAGETFESFISPNGWTVLEDGPIRSVIQAEGKHRSQLGQQSIDFEVRLYAYAGKPWVRFDYQLIHKEAAPELSIHALELKLEMDTEHRSASDVQLGLGRSNYETLYLTGDGNDRLSHLIDAEEVKFEANEHIPETFFGTFWTDWSLRGKGGAAATIFQAHQNFPKALQVDSKSMTVSLIPEGMPVHLLQGMAKTHRLFLHLHSEEESIQDVNIRSHQFQYPDRPVLDPEVYERAGVMEPLIVAQKNSGVERALTVMADSRVRAYGLLHWGDAPDAGYSEQGRGKGEWVWSNNEYDFPHAASHLFARTGVRRFQDYMLVAAEHWMDVDICHFSEDPLRFQGQIMHSARHVTEKAKVCHQWVEGLLDYYHFTGEPRALDAAIGIGKNVQRLLSTPRFQQEGGINARESGWALRSLGALYAETGDEQWLEAADRIVGHFEAWKAKHGAWLSPYTSHTVIRVPFMISVAANSLMRYYRLRPQERIKKMIVDAMNDLLEHALLADEGVFYYKELPSLQRLNTNPIILESLAYAYEFTGEQRYLEAGRVTFQTAIERMGLSDPSARKEISGDAVIWWGGASPKRFAQYYYPIFYFYRTASRAGVLESFLSYKG
jgi:hypothetical protein